MKTHYLKFGEKFCLYCYLNKVAEDYIPRRGDMGHDQTYKIGSIAYTWVYDNYYRLKNLNEEELDQEIEETTWLRNYPLKEAIILKVPSTHTT